MGQQKDDGSRRNDKSAVPKKPSRPSSGRQRGAGKSGGKSGPAGQSARIDMRAMQRMLDWSLELNDRQRTLIQTMKEMLEN
jgi:hypothetical protein